jgi:DNA modification methylase
MRDIGLPIKHVLIWVKNKATFTMGRLDYEYQHEPILFTWNKTHKRIGEGKFKTSCWFYNTPLANDIHPSMKPIGLVENAILNSSEVGDIIVDPFCGSGTSIIAAEETGRKCYGMEIDPYFVDAIIRRWQDHTGCDAVCEGRTFKEWESAQVACAAESE